MHFSSFLCWLPLSDNEDLDDDSKEVTVNENELEDEDPKIPWSGSLVTSETWPWLSEWLWHEDLKVIEFKNGLEKFPDKDLVEEASDLGLLDGGEDDSSVEARELV